MPDILSCLSQPTPRLALAAQEHGLETRLRPQFVTVEAGIINSLLEGVTN